MSKGYRQNVGAILRRHDDLLLMCERIRPAGSWQFPQGGVDASEDLEEAMWRELGEELGFAEPRTLCTVVAQGPGCTYDFPPGYDAPIARRYRGQLQTLYLLDFHGDDDDFDLQRDAHPEFRDIRWVKPSQAVELIWEFKRPVVSETLRAFADALTAGYTAI